MKQKCDEDGANCSVSVAVEPFALARLSDRAPAEQRSSQQMNSTRYIMPTLPDCAQREMHATSQRKGIDHPSGCASCAC